MTTETKGKSRPILYVLVIMIWLVVAAYLPDFSKTLEELKAMQPCATVTKEKQP